MTPRDPEPREPWMEQALSALGEACQLPADVEERLLASDAISSLFAEEYGLSDSAAPGGVAAGDEALDRSADEEAASLAPRSGVFDSPASVATRGALSALADECAIPEDVEARILNTLFDAPAPVIRLDSPPRRAAESPAIHGPIAPAPVVTTGALTGLLHRAKKDASRDRRMGVAAVLGAVAVTLLGLFAGPSPAPTAAAPAPVNVNASPMAVSDPAFGELGMALTAMLGDVARECRGGVASAVVWFERSGQVSVLDVAAPRGANGARAGDPGCVERVAARHRLGPHDRAILVQVAQVTAREGAPPAASEVRVTAWWVNES